MVDVELVVAVSAPVAADAGGVLVDAVTDPLDGSVWVRLSTPATSRAVIARLLAFGLGIVERRDARVQVTGWDARLLRRRLGIALAGVDDLRAEWDATAELVRYHYGRRAAVVGDPAPAEVLADVEVAMRLAVPIPHQAPATSDVDTLLQLVEAAEDAYAQLLSEHLDYAAQVLADLDGRNYAEGA